MKKTESDLKRTKIDLSVKPQQPIDSEEITAQTSDSGIYRLCSKISNTFLFLFSNKKLDVGAGIHKMLVNREDPSQTAPSDLGLHCLSRHSWQARSV